MSVIENFAELSAKEQLEFAVALLKTINSENTFSKDTEFEVVSVKADDFTGELEITVSHTNPIEVPRKASWQCGDEDEATEDPGYDAEYEESIYKDAEKAFKTLSTVIEGYKVSLDVNDVDENETVEVEANHISHEDGGIGDYEYWGDRGYDSRPYVEVEGTIVKSCDCALTFTVEPEEESAVEEDNAEDGDFAPDDR